MSAPALPRPTVDTLRAESDSADAAYTQAIRDAAQTGNWFGVPAYKHAARQAKSALDAAEEQA